VAGDATSLLDGAARLIGQGWAQGADARDGDGAAVKPWEYDAVAWSLLGALVACMEKVAESSEGDALHSIAAACHALAEILDTESLEAWNDAPERTQVEVADALRLAAAAASRAPTSQPFSLN
jgi:hypothetical protein